MADLLGALIFLVALVVSVMLHETGHFVTAKRFGMKCTRYFFGFGPTLWSTWRGETEYGVKALPLGGFVKIVGMTSLEDVDPQDEARSFRRAPGWQRVIVLVAGSFMHLLLAAVLIFGVAAAIGVANSNTTQLGTVEACVPANNQALESGTCTAGDAKSPAALAGLKVGDQVTSFNGMAVSSWTQLTNEILKVKPGTKVTLTVLRDGHSLTLPSTALADVPGHGSYIGIAATTVLQRQNPIAAIQYIGTGFAEVFSGMAQTLSQLPAALPKLFVSGPNGRSSTAAGNLVTVVGAAQMTGDAVTAQVGWQYKVSFVLLLIASINIFWGVFNMVPLLPLDGGHVAVVIWERARAWFARLRRLPDPGLADYRKLVPLSFSIFVLVIAFSLVLVYADIVNPVTLG